MKRKYEGTPEGEGYEHIGSVDVWTDGVGGMVGRALPLYLDECNHSPTGFGWNYGGSGPAQLAYAILRNFSGDPEFAQRLHQRFKADVIAKLPRGEWTIEGEDIACWIATLNDQDQDQDQGEAIDCDTMTLDDAGVEDFSDLDKEQTS